ncbi:MAG: succinate dehydrogenase cytochrome b subunit [Planctomycetia bacterium]|nr:succinate dehydrogenase cytochrome b subunit [Planctomycetia bacterium]
MKRFWEIFGTSIGCKAVMAVTGLLLFLFVIAHLLGNLLVFAGQDALNDYAAKLQGLGAGLWIARLGLLAIFVVHIYAAFRLTRINALARPEPYQKEESINVTFASRQMLASGLVVLLFVIYHLLHFTLGVIDSGAFGRLDAKGRHDVYAMVVQGFQNPFLSLTYVFAMVVLGLHLWHGAPSLFQTLGLKHPAWETCIRRTCQTVVALVVLGNCLMPLSILFLHESFTSK